MHRVTLLYGAVFFTLGFLSWERQLAADSIEPQILISEHPDSEDYVSPLQVRLEGISASQFVAAARVGLDGQTPLPSPFEMLSDPTGMTIVFDLWNSFPSNVPGSHLLLVEVEVSDANVTTVYSAIHIFTVAEPVPLPPYPSSGCASQHPSWVQRPNSNTLEFMCPVEAHCPRDYVCGVRRSQERCSCVRVRRTLNPRLRRGGNPEPVPIPGGIPAAPIANASPSCGGSPSVVWGPTPAGFPFGLQCGGPCPPGHGICIPNSHMICQCILQTGVGVGGTPLPGYWPLPPYVMPPRGVWTGSNDSPPPLPPKVFTGPRSARQLVQSVPQTITAREGATVSVSGGGS